MLTPPLLRVQKSRDKEMPREMFRLPSAFVDFSILLVDRSKAERFADSKTRYRLRWPEAVRDLSTAFVLLTSLKMTGKACTIQNIHKLSG